MAALRTKQIIVTKDGNPGRVITFSTRGVSSDGLIHHFVHRYNPSEFDPIIGKCEREALDWLAENGWQIRRVRKKVNQRSIT